MEKGFRGEPFTPTEIIEKDFGIGVARAVGRLKGIAQDKNFESLMHSLQRMLASDGIEISERQFKSLEGVLSKNKRELGLDSESK